MKVTRNTLIKNNVLTIACLVIGIAIIMIYSSVISSRNLASTSNKFKDFYLEENKTLVKQEVLNQLEAIRYEKLLVEERELNLVKHEILHLGFIIKDMDLKAIEDPKERQKQAVLMFEKMADFDDDHLYFILDASGHLLKSGTDKSIEGKNLYDDVDDNGVFYAREMLKSMDQPEGLFVTYSWPKVKGGPPEKKTSFCYYIPEYDLVFGAGVYHSDIDDLVMDNVYKRLRTYYENEEAYIFVMTNDGICMVHGEPELIGTDITGTVNHDGRNLHDMFVEMSQEGGFVTYTYNRLDSDLLLDKISYTERLEGWDAYIAMGFYTEDLIEINNANDDELKRQNKVENYVNIIGLSIVTVFLFLLIRRGSYLQAEYMKQEEIVFSELFKQVTEGIVIVGKNKVLYKNDKAITYFGHRVDQVFSQGIELLEKVDQNVYKLENDRVTYYVEINEKALQYKGISAHMYLVKNITSTYLQVNDYQRISMIDELSSLPNRRALIHDFSNMGHQDLKHTVVGLIDLDNFKTVNDTYGHDRGDEIIVELGQIFKGRLRKNDRFYRYGGEEFVVVFKDIKLLEAKKLLDLLNEDMNMSCQNKYDLMQTFSGGIVAVDLHEKVDLDDYISRADKLMYLAKEKGRNRIEYLLDQEGTDDEENI